MKRAFSAGGVVYKFENEKLKVLLISVKNNKVWALPKGLVEKDEKPEQTALREIKEETGVDGKIKDTIGEVSYWFYLNDEKYFKTVKYYLVEYISGNINPDDEVDSAKWFSPQEALERLTYGSDKEILKKALEKIGA
ncbi:NUDIX hydrolase [Thermodesulfovibrio sp.]|uniref:NUDIX hydrolase n=1 Tax=Thermodesulfovibrio sp. TaxID=2067987 RepID=UPI0030A79791